MEDRSQKPVTPSCLPLNKGGVFRKLPSFVKEGWTPKAAGEVTAKDFMLLSFPVLHFFSLQI